MKTDMTLRTHDSALTAAAVPTGAILLTDDEIAAVGGGISWEAEGAIGAGMVGTGTFWAVGIMVVGAGAAATGIGVGVGAAMITVGVTLMMDATTHTVQTSRKNN